MKLNFNLLLIHYIFQQSIYTDRKLLWPGLITKGSNWAHTSLVLKLGWRLNCKLSLMYLQRTPLDICVIYRGLFIGTVSPFLSQWLGGKPASEMVVIFEVYRNCKFNVLNSLQCSGCPWAHSALCELLPSQGRRGKRKAGSQWKFSSNGKNPSQCRQPVTPT